MKTDESVQAARSFTSSWPQSDSWRQADGGSGRNAHMFYAHSHSAAHTHAQSHIWPHPHTQIAHSHIPAQSHTHTHLTFCLGSQPIRSKLHTLVEFQGLCWAGGKQRQVGGFREPHLGCRAHFQLEGASGHCQGLVYLLHQHVHPWM